jgi:hypothetical protein
VNIFNEKEGRETPQDQPAAEPNDKPSHPLTSQRTHPDVTVSDSPQLGGSGGSTWLNWRRVVSAALFAFFRS